jgi:hypothetical protein
VPSHCTAALCDHVRDPLSPPPPTPTPNHQPLATIRLRSRGREGARLSIGSVSTLPERRSALLSKYHRAGGAGGDDPRARHLRPNASSARQQCTIRLYYTPLLYAFTIRLYYSSPAHNGICIFHKIKNFSISRGYYLHASTCLRSLPPPPHPKPHAQGTFV